MSKIENDEEASNPNSNTDTNGSNIAQPAEGPKPSSDSENIVEKGDQILVPSGRTRTGKNALVHGLYASDIVLEWESEIDFECLFRDLKSEWMPRGRQEMETVLSLARLNFLKHRLMRSSQMAFRSDPFLAEAKKAGAKTWSDISDLMQQKATEQDSLITDMRTASQELTTALKHASAAMTAADKDSQDIYRKVEVVHDNFKKFHGPLYGKVFNRLFQKNPKVHDKNAPDAYIERPELFAEQAYHPDYLEKLVRLEASIDTRIDKLLQRLTSIKEYKRLARESTKTIPSS